jgi:putative glutamine amidotransferase
MSPSPLIAIPCGLYRDAGKGRFATPEAYVRALAAVGATPVLLPPSGPTLAALGARGLLLAGGGDVDPRLFGQEPNCRTEEVDLERDALELACAREALESGIPVLGICRGMQVLNVAAGGTLFQDIYAEAGAWVKHRQETTVPLPTHAIALEPGTVLAGVFGAAPVAQVNSFHHQAVRDVAPGFVASARAKDGIIEGLERPGGPFALGVQYHPERVFPEDASARRLFERFVAATR